MSKIGEYILRWQYGITVEEIKLHYTYGHKEELLKKAEILKKDDRITYITLDRIEEVLKDTREKEIMKMLRQGE